MAKEELIPPYHKPVYLDSVALGLQQVAEVKSTAVDSVLDTGYKNPAEARLQEWWIDPWRELQSQYFVHLNDDQRKVLQSPEEDGHGCFINLQGIEPENHGIQVWIFEPVSGPIDNVWRLKNLKTNFYLYVDTQGGETGIPVIAVRCPSLKGNAEWKVEVRGGK